MDGRVDVSMSGTKTNPKTHVSCDECDADTDPKAMRDGICSACSTYYLYYKCPACIRGGVLCYPCHCIKEVYPFFEIFNRPIRVHGMDDAISEDPRGFTVCNICGAEDLQCEDNCARIVDCPKCYYSFYSAYAKRYPPCRFHRRMCSDSMAARLMKLVEYRPTNINDRGWAIIIRTHIDAMIELLEKHQSFVANTI